MEIKKSSREAFEPQIVQSDRRQSQDDATAEKKLRRERKDRIREEALSGLEFVVFRGKTGRVQKRCWR